MISSIKKYGGFYVGRYEMGRETNYSKINALPTSANDSETLSWYGLYSKAKAYTKTGINCQMIWGSQYDAMLNFILTGRDNYKVSQNTNGSIGSILAKTGIWRGSDSMNNLFDLESNLMEWTQESYDLTSRVIRGECCWSNFMDDRLYAGADWSSGLESNVGTRLSFYINE